MNRLEKYYDPQVRNNILMLPPPPLIDSASSRTSTWTYKTTGFSLLDRGERIKPERSNRRNVQKMQWRNSRWVKSFPDGDYDYNELDSRISSMTIADVSPRFAVRRIILLYENFQYREAANFVNRLSHGTFKVIINDLPIDLFIESMPHSLSILEALYAKVFLSDGLNFSIKTLRPEGVVMQMVKFFSTQDEGINSSKWELCGPFICSCKKLLKVIVLSDPKIKKILNQRRRSLDKAIEGMGQHGLVGTSDETLMNLHDALKVEFQKVVETYKEALQKLEELSLANKTTVTRSISHGPAPIQASHQRQLSLRQEEIQERLIKNKTLLNVVEPSLGSNSLGILLGILQRRIEYDKDVLFQFSQLRKEVKNVDANSIVAPILMHYSHGCEAVLELMKEVAEDEDDSSDISGYHSDSDSAIMMSGNSPYISKRARYNFLTRSVRSGSKSSVRTSVLNSSSGISSGLNSGSASGSDSPSTEEKGDSPISTPTPNPSHIPTRPRQLKHKKELQKLNSAASSSSSGTIPCCQGCRPRASLQTLPPSNDQEVSILRAEMENLRAELSRAKNSVVTLQETEKRLKERLAAQAQKHLEFNGCRFENVGMGERRPTALIRRYGNLYAQARVDTLDALDNLTELKDAEELKSKILFSVVVLAFRSVQSTLLLKKEQVRKILHMPPPPPVQSQSSAAREADTVAAELERSIALYLRRTVDKYDLTKNIDEVLSQIWATLYDYPCLKSCEGLIQYVKDSVRLAWGLINQAPPFVLEYEQRIFRKDVHIRFHTSNQESQHIKTYLWPALLEGTSGPCVHKGVVIT